MPSIKLIGIDLDGTFFAPDGKPSEASLQAVSECAFAGIHVCMCTGRSLAQIREIMPIKTDLGDLCALTHGASIVNRHTGEYVLHRRIDPEVIDPLMRALSADCKNGEGRYFSATGMFQTHMLASCTKQCTVNRWSHLSVPTHMIYNSMDNFIAACKPDTQLIDYSVPFSDRERVRSIIHSIADLDITTANPRSLELIPKGINKGDGLARLAKHYNIPRHSVMAIGDGNNDESMIRWAGLGVSMGNAVDSLKRIADTVVASNAEEGFAQAVRRYALGY